ncbi:MAG: hypothetical protein ACXWJK_17315 [Burkholderiaceae bacterium]
MRVSSIGSLPSLPLVESIAAPQATVPLYSVSALGSLNPVARIMAVRQRTLQEIRLRKLLAEMRSQKTKAAPAKRISELID